MKRLHVHMTVDDLERAIAFYAALFDAPPSGRNPSCAEWVLENPPVNFTVMLCEHGGAAAGPVGAQDIGNPLSLSVDEPAAGAPRSRRRERTTA